MMYNKRQALGLMRMRIRRDDYHGITIDFARIKDLNPFPYFFF